MEDQAQYLARKEREANGIKADGNRRQRRSEIFSNDSNNNRKRTNGRVIQVGNGKQSFQETTNAIFRKKALVKRRFNV